MVKIPNQANYQDDQNFDIDIDSIYRDFIQEIDNNRSIVNVSNQGNQSFLKILKKETLTSLLKLVKVEETPQESRCHAFFRLIGFPVMANDNRYYNPGLDIIRGVKKIDQDQKIDIANNSIAGFKELSFKRENYINDILQTFSQNNSISASALALSSSVYVRSFSAPLRNPDVLDTKPDNQIYNANLKGQIGQLDNVQLTDYVDSLGNQPHLSKLNKTRYHYIKPFVVDARIDFTVSPSERRVAVPFVFNKSNLLVSESTFVKRPLLEKVIRERFSVTNESATLGTAEQHIREYILSVSSIRDEKLIQQMTSKSNVYQLSEQLQFVKYLNIIRAMMAKLVESQLMIQKAQSEYYWLPIPSITGPEGGSSVRRIIISDKIPSNFITSKDKSLILATLKQISSQFNAQTAPLEGIPDAGGFAFDSFKTTFDNDTSTALGDSISHNLTELSNHRRQTLRDASEALRTIEIIMGEFSGLGLCDIIAIMGALYIMPREDLLGFLDADAFDRMLALLSLQQAGLSNPGILPAMQSFFSRVLDFYNLMDKIYADLRQNNGLN